MLGRNRATDACQRLIDNLIDPVAQLRILTRRNDQMQIAVRHMSKNMGAIRADEWRLVKNVERKNRDLGDFWGSVLGLYHRFATGEWLSASEQIKVDWHDPATPTLSQQADAIQKMAGKPILSVQGALDELGWSEARKARELQYRADESDNQLFADVMGKLGASQVSQ